MFRSCMVTLISIRNSLAPGPGISQFPAETLTSMLSDLGMILNILKRLSLDDAKLLLFRNHLIAIIPNATSELGSGIPFREEYEKHIKITNEKRAALKECLSACQECSETLDSILREPNNLPILKRFGLDK